MNLASKVIKLAINKCSEFSKNRLLKELVLGSIDDQMIKTQNISAVFFGLAHTFLKVNLF